jgi:hypothetical protein
MDGSSMTGSICSQVGFGETSLLPRESIVCGSRSDGPMEFWLSAGVVLSDVRDGKIGSLTL